MARVADRIELRTIYLAQLVGAARDEVDRILRTAITAFDGQEFNSTEDGMFAAFGSVSAAVSCAVLTQQLVEYRYRGAELPARVRIGLGTGEATIKHDNYFGMPAIEAARLCAKAPPDEIYISDVTRELASHVDGVRFGPAGALELKGYAEPMEVFSVGWEPLDPERLPEGVGRWPLPHAIRATPRISYVGRLAERRLLDEAREQSLTGSRQIVLLSGEPGIGKTRLASHAALAATTAGFATCWGTCSDDIGAPYEPWTAVCTHIVDHLPDDALMSYIDRFGGEIGRVAHNLARRVPHAPAPQLADPETERLLLFNAVTELLRAASATGPLYVVLDDFHWADAQSVALLKHVATGVTRGALVVLVTFRETDIRREHPLTGTLADLRRVDGVVRVALTGLGTGEVAQLLRAFAGHELDPDGTALSAELADETGGNPFFVGEILRNLAETGAIVQDDDSGRWSIDRAAPVRVPASVREVIGRRVDRLGDDGREFLTAAAVIGRSFEVWLLASVLDVDEERLLDLLDDASEAALVRESAEHVGQFSFEHALINATLVDGLGATRRGRLHRRVAEALEAELGEDPSARVAELATHWAKVAPADRDKALTYARLAGEHALRELVPDEAVRWFTSSLAMLTDRDDRALHCDLLVGLGEAQRGAGIAEYRQTLLEAAQLASELQDGRRAALAALANSRTSGFGLVDEARMAAIERALELDDDADRRARLLADQTMELVYEPDPSRRRAVSHEALTLARGLGDPRTTAAALTNWFRVRQVTDCFEERRRHVDELEEVGARSGDSPIAFVAAAVVRSTLVECGLIDRARRAFDQMERIAERLRDPELDYIVFYSRATWAMLVGDLDTAERESAAALQLGTQLGEPDALTIYGAQLVVTRILQGRADEILELLEQAISANPEIVGFAAARARILCTVGRTEEARVMLAEAAALRFEHVTWEPTRSVTLAMYAEAAAGAGHREAAALLYEMIEPAGEQIVWNSVVCYGHQGTYLGLLAASLGRDEQADEHFARAIDVQERAGLQWWAERARRSWADALVARGDEERAAAIVEPPTGRS